MRLHWCFQLRCFSTALRALTKGLIASLVNAFFLALQTGCDLTLAQGELDKLTAELRASTSFILRYKSLPEEVRELFDLKRTLSNKDHLARRLEHRYRPTDFFKPRSKANVQPSLPRGTHKAVPKTWAQLS